jgi:hypothetical protein
MKPYDIGPDILSGLIWLIMGDRVVWDMLLSELRVVIRLLHVLMKRVND